MYRLEFELPGLPRMQNASGRSKHWAVMANEAKKWKSAVMAECLGKRPFAGVVTTLIQAKLTLTRFSSVSPDPDGLVSSFKHVIDGLVAGGVLKNDRFENISMPIYLWEKVAPSKGRIRVIVESIEKKEGKV